MRFRPLLALVLALCLTLVTACSGGAKAVDRANLTYDDIHNTGLANDCPTLPDSARGSISLDASAKYQLREICMHPSEVYVKGEPANKRQEAQFVPTKILTRFTTSQTRFIGLTNRFTTYACSQSQCLFNTLTTYLSSFSQTFSRQ